jgi:hypothetical protein
VLPDGPADKAGCIKVPNLVLPVLLGHDTFEAASPPVLLGHDHKLFGRVVNGIRVEQWRMQRRLLPGYGRKLRPARQVCIREYGFYRGFWGWRLIRE